MECYEMLGDKCIIIIILCIANTCIIYDTGIRMHLKKYPYNIFLSALLYLSHDQYFDYELNNYY